jgi:tetratricopeptide (TPR) repeat protein
LSLGVTYALIGNIVTLIGTIFAERIAYLPSAFAVILLAMLIARLPRNIGAGLMIVLLALCSIRTVTWARDWNDPLTLYRASLENCPRSLQLHFLVAQEYHNAADEPDAQAVMADATDMYPRFWQAWMQRASHALDAGRLEDAAEYLRTAQALEANPRLLEVRGRLNRMVDAKNRAKKTR